MLISELFYHPSFSLAHFTKLSTITKFWTYSVKKKKSVNLDSGCHTCLIYHYEQQHVSFSQQKRLKCDKILVRFHSDQELGLFPVKVKRKKSITGVQTFQMCKNYSSLPPTGWFFKGKFNLNTKIRLWTKILRWLIGSSWTLLVATQSRTQSRTQSGSWSINAKLSSYWLQHLNTETLFLHRRP